ncbi:hypothetical protein ACP3V3_19740 [Vibrio sp. PNB22_3_1]
MALQQMDIFEFMESAKSSIQGGGFLPLAKRYETVAKRMTKYRNHTLSGNLLTVSATPFETGGGWLTYSLKLENGEDVYFRINSDIEMRFPDDRAMQFEVRTYDQSYLLCVSTRCGGGVKPLFVLDMDTLREVLGRSKRQGEPISQYPTFRYSYVDAYQALEFGTVFSGEGESQHRLFVDNFTKVSLVFTSFVEELISQHVLHDSGPFYHVQNINADVYRLDVRYDQIIGGGTLCFFKSPHFARYIADEEQAYPKVAVAKRVVNRTVSEELQMLIVKDDTRIELPVETLTHYAAIKRLLEEADGKYDDGGFRFCRGDASAVYEALVSGQKVRKRRKAYNFFATKGEWAQNVVDAVQIKSGMRVAEFHAGHGAISDLVRECGVEPIVNELWHENADTLRDKGYRDVLEMDFLSMTEQDIGGKVDVIVGNPPWERLADISHFNHAMTLLADGGAISMLISPSYKTSKTKKAKAFREFLKLHNASEFDVPSGAFENTKMAGVHIVISDYSPA